MPRLPDATDLGQRPIPVSRRSIATVRNAGLVAETASQSIAGAMEQWSSVIQKRQDMQREQRYLAEAQQAESDFLTSKIQIDSDFAHDQDFDTQEERYRTAITTAHDQASQKITAPRLRQEFSVNAKPVIERGAVAIQERVFNGHRDTALADAYASTDRDVQAALAAPDQKDAEALVQGIGRRLTTLREAGYISQQEEVQKRRTITQGYAEGRLALLPAEDQVTTLAASIAAETANPNGKTGTFVDYIPLDRRADHLRVAVARVRADERMQRAEQRLEMAARVDKAKEVGRLLDDGIPLPPGAIDGAISVADEAGDEALSYRLRTGKIKGALSLEYKASAPAELQDAVNTLSARISRAGAKAKPEDVIARDHLSGMLEKTSRAVSEDPLSWLAGARGVKIPPLDWDNPATINARLHAARVASGETGAPLSPLTNEEIAELKTGMAQGTGGRVHVLDKIRRLGTAGGVAVSRQLAPTDDLFRMAVVLANQSGMELAKDAISGADAITTNPQLFEEARAKKQFASEVVPAIRFLPTDARLGLFQAARNIYGAAMSREGHTRWQEKSWLPSVNIALGGKPGRDGVWRGGLGRLHGATTVLPPSMTQKEAEDTLARATDASLAAAGNGTPLWANGTRVTISQFRRLRLEMAPSGRYRLSDGDGFVSVKGGGPFEMDLAELRRRSPPAPKRVFRPQPYKRDWQN